MLKSRAVSVVNSNRPTLPDRREPESQPRTPHHRDLVPHFAVQGSGFNVQSSMLTHASRFTLHASRFPVRFPRFPSPDSDLFSPRFAPVAAGRISIFGISDFCARANYSRKTGAELLRINCGVGKGCRKECGIDFSNGLLFLTGDPNPGRQF